MAKITMTYCVTSVYLLGDCNDLEYESANYTVSKERFALAFSADFDKSRPIASMLRVSTNMHTRAREVLRVCRIIR